MSTKRRPAPDAGLVQQVATLVRQSTEPLKAPALRQALGAGAPGKAQLDQALRGLVAAGTVFKVKLGRSAAFAGIDPDTRVRPALLAEAAKGPLTAAELEKSVKAAVPGATSRGVRSAQRALLSEGALRRHPPVGTGRSDRFAVQPPDPSLYFARQVSALRNLERELAECGVTPEAWKVALARALVLPLAVSSAGATTSPAPVAAGDEAAVLGAIHRLAASEPQGALLSIARVRELCTLDKARFDAAMLALGAARKVVLHYHDFPQSLSPERREALVVDGSGVHYVGVALEGGR